MVKYSVIITSWKEPMSIGKAIECIADKNYSSIPDEYELIQVSPDEETLVAGRAKAQQLNLGEKFVQIIDPHKGKPYALHMALEAAKGEIIVLTDGDVYFGQDTMKHILEPFSDEKIGGVSGQPVSQDKKDNMMAYFGHLLTASADHKRKNDLKTKVGNYYTSKDKFFAMSGYIYAVRNLKFSLPSDLLVEDAYMSYLLFNKGFQIAYAPLATAFVKFPRTVKDYLKQKIRSLGGYTQLKKYPEIANLKKSRTFLDELKYFWFPFAYAKNVREFFWSLMLFPIRLYTWFRIFVERIVMKKGMSETGWERIETTK